MHAKAHATLSTEPAKKAAQERGIADPVRSEICLKCHSTGFGEPPERFLKGFDPKAEVRCESCHGPGEKHFKARLSASPGGKGPLTTRSSRNPG